MITEKSLKMRLEIKIYNGKSGDDRKEKGPMKNNCRVQQGRILTPICVSLPWVLPRFALKDSRDVLKEELLQTHSHLGKHVSSQLLQQSHLQLNGNG